VAVQAFILRGKDMITELKRLVCELAKIREEICRMHRKRPRGNTSQLRPKAVEKWAEASAVWGQMSGDEQLQAVLAGINPEGFRRTT